MEHETEALRGAPLEVRQIRAALTREFVGLLDMEDVTTGSPALRERVFLSRALAAKAVRLVADCTSAEGAAAVVDAADDHGIDAVFVSPATAEIWLIQAKWSAQGTARLDVASVQGLLHGVQQLLDLRYDRFNGRFQQLVPGIDALLGRATVRLHLVLAALADEGLSPEAHELLHEGVRDFNQYGELLDIRTLSVSDFHAIVRNENLPEPATITATLSDGWHMNSTPYPTYLGTVSAEELAGWYEQLGVRLFDQNVRFALGATEVNTTMVDSLLSAPQEFWYLNNGITVLCDSVRTTYIARRAQGQPVRLELGNPRVVNGAQTVAAARQAYEQEPRTVADALVSVRLICLDGAPNDLAQRITRATNTQNHVEAQDFAAMDPQQELIRQDFVLTLGKSYVLKRGGTDPSPAAGCTMAEAALALTCAHPDAALLARYLADGDVLWHGGPNGFYSRLFDNRPGALQIWRSVRLLRQVRDELAVLAGGLEGRERVVADRAELLVAHVVFQLIGGDGIDEPGDDWEARGQGAAKRAAEILAAMTDHLNTRYGQYAFLTRILRDEQSCRDLVLDVLRSLQHGTGRRPVSPQRPRRGRKPNAVPLLVQHRVIDDGAQLIYRPGTVTERDALSEWLSRDPERYLATWINDARKPLIWAFDGQQYSPSGLVMQLWEKAEWPEQPVAVQGTRRWYLPGEGTLADLADELLADMEAAGDGPGVE
ncbi:AIPR family protein [Streptomyces sp. NPDC059447]|uniref:AIPR family protein n=1 Tax=Streptomyces sp. NPDC059447 TaxID=3346834 RepID=UPI0036AFE289